MSATTTTPPTPWPIVKLGDVCEINLGKTPPRGDFRCWDKGRETDNVWLSIADLLNHKDGKVLDSKEYITDFAVESTGISRVAKGTLLLSFKLTLGRTAIAGKDLFTNEAIAALPIKDAYVAKIDVKYLMVYFSHFDWLEFAAKDEKVLGKTLNKKKLAIIPIPLPPLDIQREIVAKVEAGLKEADALAMHFKRLATLADDTFKAELDETFGTLNAPTVKLGDVCEVIKRLKDIACDKFHYIDISSINRDKKTINEITEYERNLAPGRAQQVVEKGDVLVSTVRPNLNAVAMVEGDSVIQRIASTGFCVLRPNKNILSQFIYYFTQTEIFITTLVAVSEKASYPSVTDSVVKGVSIPLPSLDIQREIVAKLEAVKARCERLKAEAERGLKAAEALRKAVLAEAFEQ